MPQWEYKVEEQFTPYGPDDTAQGDVELLNILGKNNWELAGAVFLPKWPGKRFYFKRELPPEPEGGSGGE